MLKAAWYYFKKASLRNRLGVKYSRYRFGGKRKGVEMERRTVRRSV